MKRGGPLRRLTALTRAPISRGSMDRPGRSRRSTGPAPEVRVVVFTRAGGRCERCGTLVGRIPYSIHHRQPRGMGGSRDAATNSPTNLLLLCGSGTTGCHGWAESHRADATRVGIIVPRPADPASTPVMLRDGRHVLLDPQGGYAPVRIDG